MSNIKFTDEGWDDYLYWQTQDKKTLKRLNQLIKDISRNGYNGIAKCEPLKNNLSGYWSKRIDEKNRLIFYVTDEEVTIVQCRGHYND